MVQHYRARPMERLGTRPICAGRPAPAGDGLGNTWKRIVAQIAKDFTTHVPCVAQYGATGSLDHTAQAPALGFCYCHRRQGAGDRGWGTEPYWWTRSHL